jgi:hypothetical protein
MGAIVQRVVVPAATVLAGIAAMVYGAMYHRAPVAQQEIEEQEVEEEVTKTIRVPVPVAPGAGSAPWGGVWSGQKPGPGGETAPPGMAFVTQTVKVLETVRRPVQVTKTREVPEPAMIFEITVGGIAWSPHGLRRTYAPGEPPPSLCPT